MYLKKKYNLKIVKLTIRIKHISRKLKNVNNATIYIRYIMHN